MYKTSFGIKNYSKNSGNPFYIAETYKTVQINANHIAKVFSLSRTSLKLLFYLINNYRVDSGIVRFNLQECKKDLRFSNKRSVYNALIELLGEQIIARTTSENMYYLNTGIICIGE